MPETNPTSAGAVAGGGLLPGETRGGGLEANGPLGLGTHWAKSLGPVQSYKCTASHLALHFSNFLQVHLEHIRKGSDWFGKCLGNSGRGRWSWKPVGKNMTPRQSSQLWLESRSPAPLPPTSFSCCFCRPKPQTQPRPCSMNSNGSDSNRNP